ncbi:MAG TPA: class I SAM-dependent methyltransferase [Acidimicrobiia bacterium]
MGTDADADISRTDDDARIGDYGLDARRVVVWLGFGAFGAGMVMLFAAVAHAPGWLTLGAFGACVVLGLAALVLTWSSRVGKLRERVRLVEWLDLRADAYVLDAGCGSGLVLVEAAKRTPLGLSVGIEQWRAVPNVPSVAEVVLENADAEGVDDNVVVTNSSMTRLPFADDTFDVVTSCFVLHRIGSRAARLDAIREAARVLVPGGRLVVLDSAKTKQVVAAMRSVDLAGVTRSRRILRLIPAARYVTGSKPSR